MEDNILRFSIIIPVYNAAKLLPKCLNSLKNQTYKNFEVIALDDESKDNSFEILNEFKLKNPTMKINISSHQNCGAGKTRNLGLKKANGEYIVFIDSDDYVDCDYLEKIDRIIDDNNSDIVFIDIIRESETSELLRYERMSDFSHLSKDRMIRWQLTGKMPWGGVRKIIKSEIVRNGKLEYAPIKVGEESIYSFLALMNANKVSFQKESYYHYVDSSTSLTSHDNVNNPQCVFDFISGYINDNNYTADYGSTLNALGVTTVVILINILAQELPFIKAIRQSHVYLRKYKSSIIGQINYDALEKRVLICYPFMRIGVIFPIILLSYFQRIFKKK